MLSLGKLSSEVTTFYKESRSDKSLMYKNEKSIAEKSLPICSTGMYLFLAKTSLLLISLIRLRLPDDLSPRSSKKESFWSSRLTTSFKIDFQRFTFFFDGSSLFESATAAAAVGRTFEDKSYLDEKSF